MIVGGDFNLHTDREPDASQLRSLLEATGLRDVCSVVACEDPGRIDKFLFRSGRDVVLTPRSRRFEIGKFVSPEGESLSDHDALAVRFTWSAISPFGCAARRPSGPTL